MHIAGCKAHYRGHCRVHRMHCTLKYGTLQYTGYTAWCSAHYRLHCTVQVHSREQNITKSDKLSILSVSVKPSVESASIVSTATEGHIVLFSQVASWWNFSVLGNTFAPLYCYLCLPFKNKLYLSKLQSVFVQITKCICPTSQSVLGNSFAALYCYHWLPARVTQRVSGCERGEKQTKRWNTGWNFSTALSGWYNLFVVKFWADMFEQNWYWSSQTSG